ncbi:MAG: FkbM family methyltransferase [Anaerolineales bacterium]|jgi:FkbM family methyltransferase
MKIPNAARRRIRKTGTWIFGRNPKTHRIPFGPNKGLKIFMSFDISPRMWFGIDEPWVARSALEHVQSGDVVYDIGAHVGYTSLLYAQRVGNQGVVHAFEILPIVVEDYLQRTIQANSFNNVVTHDVGLSNQDQVLYLPIGETMMTSQESKAGEGQHVEACRITTLDQYVKNHKLPLPNYIKIDIEGAEVDCLVGGEATLRKSKPLMMIEFHSTGLLQSGFSLLDAWGYQLMTKRGVVLDTDMLGNLKYVHESVLCLPKNHPTLKDSAS